MYEPRFYRNQMLAKDLCSFEVKVKETDLFICATKDLSDTAYELVLSYREQIESFIEKFPLFKSTFTPIEIPNSAPDIVKTMGDAAKLAGVGPMAAVAGAMAEYVGNGLLEHSDEVIIENGGDIFIKTNRERKMGIYAGDSPLSNRIGVSISPDDTPLGICTSSGTVGHSVSFGAADAIVVFSKNAALADATATRVGNLVHSANDIKKGIEHAQSIPGIEGIIIVAGEGLGGWGRFEFVPI